MAEIQLGLNGGDTLNNPALTENDKLMKFDLVIANPPFSLKKWGAENAELKNSGYFRIMDIKGFMADLALKKFIKLKN